MDEIKEFYRFFLKKGICVSIGKSLLLENKENRVELSRMDRSYLAQPDERKRFRPFSLAIKRPQGYYLK